MKEYHTRRAAERRAAVAKIKVDRGCTDCRYNADHRALEFDHLPEFEKSRTVASLMFHSWERIMQEIDKCEVVCCNCHAIRTHERRG